jgi:hypothetical protein
MKLRFLILKLVPGSFIFGPGPARGQWKANARSTAPIYPKSYRVYLELPDHVYYSVSPVSPLRAGRRRGSSKT